MNNLRLTLCSLMTIVATNVRAESPAPVNVTLQDQFQRPVSVAKHPGEVVVLVYGDRGATESCKQLGSRLHVLFHPSAAGQPAEKAHLAPVAPLTGLPVGTTSPNVLVVPVAVAGKVPNVVQRMLCKQIQKASPTVPVWLDFDDTMKTDFGLRESQPNIVVIDGKGQLRMRINGTPDEQSLQKMVQLIQNLRAEAVGLR